jgi:hypothetical protein
MVLMPEHSRRASDIIQSLGPVIDPPSFKKGDFFIPGSRILTELK